MNCAAIREEIDAYFDQELGAADLEKFETHLLQCSSCRHECEQVFALNKDFRDTMWDVPAPTLGFEARLQHALDREGRYWQLPFSIRVRKVSVQELSFAAVAALVVAAFFGRDLGVLSRNTQDASLMQDVVRLHAQQLPSDVSPDEPMQVSSYFRNRVGFAVHPTAFRDHKARLLGARVTNVQQYSAAALYYDVNGARVTVVVFQAPDMAADAQRMHVDNQEILYWDVAGYAISMRQQDGIHYAFLGDLDRNALIQLAAHADVGY